MNANAVNDPNSTDVRQAIQEHVKYGTRRRFRRLLRKGFNVFMLIGLLNFALFMAGTVYFGGDAWNGKIEGGTHFLWGYYNGTKGYHEVSKAVFDYSRWHVYSMMVTWPLMLLAGFASERIGRWSED
jgi:hypothetical protein